MNKTFNYLLTIILIIFSFYYTKTITDYIKNKDPIMIEIKKNKKLLDKKPIDSIIKDNTIIVGSKGLIVDINKSYSKMKKINKYDESLLVFNKIESRISVKNQYDKLIVNGIKNSKNIIILVKINDLNLLKKIKDSSINLILDNNFINDNIEYLNQINNNIVILEQKNINNLNRVNYCYVENSFNNYCRNYFKLTIKPLFITHDYYYNTYINLSTNKIFAYNIINEKNLLELNLILEAIKNLNYKIVSIDEFLNN